VLVSRRCSACYPHSPRSRRWGPGRGSLSSASIEVLLLVPGSEAELRLEEVGLRQGCCCRAGVLKLERLLLSLQRGLRRARLLPRRLRPLLGAGARRPVQRGGQVPQQLAAPAASSRRPAASSSQRLQPGDCNVIYGIAVLLGQ
jgi:hypothetical protein